MQPLKSWLLSRNDLASLCSQNGWIDDDTLRVEIQSETPNQLTLNVHFEEIVMEGAGCVAARLPCFGRLAVTLNREGEYQNLTFL